MKFQIRLCGCAWWMANAKRSLLQVSCRAPSRVSLPCMKEEPTVRIAKLCRQEALWFHYRIVARAFFSISVAAGNLMKRK